MKIRKLIDFVVMTLLLLGPAVLLSSLDSGREAEANERPQPREISHRHQPAGSTADYRF